MIDSIYTEAMRCDNLILRHVKSSNIEQTPLFNIWFTITEIWKYYPSGVNTIRFRNLSSF